MKEHTSDFNIISYALLRIVYKLTEIDKQARNYGTDCPLHVSEIHMIKEIKKSNGSHMSEIARKLDVTRGAVSQIIKKLEKKGFVNKEMVSENQLMLVPVLTDKGEIADSNHKRYHEVFNNSIKRILRKSNIDERKVIKDFLLEVEEKCKELEDFI